MQQLKDIHHEARIEAKKRELLTCAPDRRSSVCEELTRLVLQRSPEQVLRMEIRKGLI